MANPGKTELSILESSRNVFYNVETQPKIASYLSELGYDTTKMAEGKPFLDAAIALYDANRMETNEARAAYASFNEQLSVLKKKYALIRKKAKVVFHKEPLLMGRLMLNGKLPAVYVNYMSTVNVFIKEVKGDAQVQDMLARLKVSLNDVEELENELKAVELARFNYLREDGESQNATEQKDKAFANLENWMSDFYRVAKIALEDEPQLLEALGLTVKR